LAELALTELLVCPDDLQELCAGGERLTCSGCRRAYEIRSGIPILLPTYTEEIRDRYLRSYEKIARDDLTQPLEPLRHIRHRNLIRFIGDVRGQRVLDIGSSYAGYLGRLEAGQKIALDIALPFLEAIPPDSGVLRVCADAETLPIRNGVVDVVIISDVLEHLLEPEKLAARLLAVCRPNTRIIVEVPWEEDLTPYRDMPWEFTHLRRFNEYLFSRLFYRFKIVRRSPSWPALREPFLFQIGHLLPAPLYNALRWDYFHRGGAARDLAARERWTRQLPRRERLLLRVYRPFVYQFELRPLEGSWEQRAYDRVRGWLDRRPRRRRPQSDVVEEDALGAREEPAADQQQAAGDDHQHEDVERRRETAEHEEVLVADHVVGERVDGDERL